MDDTIKQLKINTPTVVEIDAPEKIYPGEPNIEENEDIEEETKLLSRQELLEKYAEIHQITIEQAEEEIGAPTEVEIFQNIQKKTLEKINSTQVPMNRAQRRALKKKVGAKKYAEMVAENGDAVGAITETAKKLNYIDLIQKLRKLNEEKQKNGETFSEDD